MNNQPVLPDSVLQPMEQARKGHYMFVYSGGRYYPLDPRLEEVHIEDIAHALSMQARFNGHTREFLSVARHCINCSNFVAPEIALEALMHDCAEAYLGDMIRPLKAIPELSAAYLAAEALNEEIIAKKFELIYPWPTGIKEIDDQMVCAEIMNLIRCDKKDMAHYAAKARGIAGLIPHTVCMKQDEEDFIDRFDELYDQRQVALRNGSFLNFPAVSQ